MSFENLNLGPRESQNEVSMPKELDSQIVTAKNLLPNSEISKHSLFNEIPYHLLEPILSECAVQSLQKGQVLISPGQENYNLS